MQRLLKITQQTSYQLIGKVISSFVAFIVLGQITRTYGEAGVGVYTLAATYLSMFFIASDLGLNAYFLPKLDNLGYASKLFNLRLFWSLILTFLANCLVFISPLETNVKLAVFLGSLSIIAAGIFNSSNLIFQYKLRYDLSVASSSLGAISMVPLSILLISKNVASPFIILAFLFGWFLTALASFILVSKFYLFKIKIPNLNFVFETFKKTWPISATLVLNVIYFRFDSFILSFFKSLSDVGVYNLSFQFFQAALVVPTFIMNGYYPLLIKDIKNENFFKQLKLFFLGMLFLGAAGTLLTFLTSNFFIRILAPQGFFDSSLVLNILSISFPAFFASSLLMWVFISLGRYKLMFLVYAIGLIFNILANLIFIPIYSYFAASFITVISEYLILLLQIVILTRIWKK